MLKPIIDYLSISIKPDSKCANPGKVDKAFIFGFLGLPDTDFFDIGPKKYYEHTYTSNHILVYEPYEAKALSQGWLIVMTGQGCRYFEQYKKEGEIVNLWREWLTQVRALSAQGYAINITRIDIATDDFEGYLDMDKIASNCNARNFVSQFRTAYEKGYQNILSGQDMGRTIYFGNRRSSTFCRFYDKLQEQRMKAQNDKTALKELEGISHWIRMEFEFKREQALKLVNMICDADNFGELYAGVVNAYIRFVDCKGANVSRYKTQSWWAKFVGTLKKVKLSVSDYKPFGYKRTLRYFDRCLTTTLCVLLSRMSPEEMLDRIYSLGFGRLKSKQLAIINEDASRDTELSSATLWDLLNPVPAEERCAYVY